MYAELHVIELPRPVRVGAYRKDYTQFDRAFDVVGLQIQPLWRRVYFHHSACPHRRFQHGVYVHHHRGAAFEQTGGEVAYDIDVRTFHGGNYPPGHGRLVLVHARVDGGNDYIETGKQLIVIVE